MHVVEGLAGGRTAIVARMHHALVDGIAAVDVSTVVLDPGPEPLELPAPDPKEPGGSASTARAAAQRVEALARLTGARLHVPGKLARDMASKALALEPRGAARQMRQAAGVVGELARIRPSAPETRLNTPIGPDRLFAMGRGRLDAIKQVRKATGATVNDILLTTVALMLSEFLEDPPDTVVALVPVSIRTEDDRDTLGNRIAAMRGPLPVYVDDPVERLRVVSESMTGLKESKQALGAEVIAGLTGFAPPTILAQASRLNFSTRLFNVIVTNVPGPQFPLYMLGRELQELIPLAFLPEDHALAIAIMSYNGGAVFGLLADYDAMPDLDRFAEAIEESLAELLAAAEAATPSPAGAAS
jgi:WS/DGAT/MGAT family acyltransferase